MTDSCKTCRFFRPTKSDEWPSECRAKPPALEATSDGGWISGWPAVNENDWCGEWSAIPPPVQQINPLADTCRNMTLAGMFGAGGIKP